MALLTFNAVGQTLTFIAVGQNLFGHLSSPLPVLVNHNCSTGVSTEFTDIKSEAYCSIKSLIC